jgi:ubiquinone/menaquinone biosynthesis C-methylase UbiE
VGPLFDAVRRFDAEYLSHTREGLWADRSALEPLALSTRESVLDVGCGTGELTAVLREACDVVYALDRDRSLLETVADPRLQGDALSLPFADDAVDLVACQALLINLPDPDAALAEFRRVASEHVAAIEPDNANVEVSSSVASEERLAERARERYLAGVETDPTLGALTERFEAAGLSDVTIRRHEHAQHVEPPYDDAAVEAARRKALGTPIDDRRSTLAAGGAAVDDLRNEWRHMGREVARAMAEESYERREVVPFYVTVGSV